MRIAVLGHSHIHPRQYLFFDYLNSSNGVEVLQIYPERCGDQTRKGGFTVANEGDIKKFSFWDDALQAIREFAPDLLYSQTEFWQSQSFRSRRWAATLKIPLVFFFWENIQSPSIAERKLIKDAALIVCGNNKCEEIITKTCPDACTVVMPQVGIRTDIFKPMTDVEKIYDSLFIGRKASEKGGGYVSRLREDGYRVAWAQGNGYDKMPEIYNQARVLLLPSLRTETWMDQWPAAAAESLACGTPVVAFDSGSIRSNYEGCPAVLFASEGDYVEFKDKIDKALSPEIIGKKGSVGRKWVVMNMSHKAIGTRLIEGFEKLIS